MEGQFPTARIRSFKFGLLSTNPPENHLLPAQFDQETACASSDSLSARPLRLEGKRWQVQGGGGATLKNRKKTQSLEMLNLNTLQIEVHSTFR